MRNAIITHSVGLDWIIVQSSRMEPWRWKQSASSRFIGPDALRRSYFFRKDEIGRWADLDREILVDRVRPGKLASSERSRFKRFRMDAIPRVVCWAAGNCFATRCVRAPHRVQAWW